MSLVQWLDRKLYPDYQNRWDDLCFRKKLDEVIRHDLPAEGCRILDVGAGSGRIPEMNLRAAGRWVCGIDPDERVHQNPYLDEAKVGYGEALGFADATFDLVFADNVLEHLKDPSAVFREVARVLKPGGIFMAKTPNRHHYVPLTARLTPFGFHRFVNRLRGRKEDDTFPTVYVANTAKDIRFHAARAGLSVREILTVEGRPEYLRIAAPTYLLGWAYERAVNSTPALSGFRAVLIATLVKAA